MTYEISADSLVAMLNALDIVEIAGIVCDVRQVIQHVNQLTATYAGVSAEALTGKVCREVDGLVSLSMLFGTKSLAKVHEMALFDGRVCEVKNQRLKDGLFLITIRDKTPQRQEEEARAAMMNMVVHDLKAPISAIKSYAELVVASGDLNSRQKQFLQRIQHAIRSMTNMVGDLLDMAWVDAHLPLETESLNIAPLVNMTVETLQERAQSRGMTIHAQFSPELPTVMGNAAKLERVFTNLIINAIKFSHEGSAITVSVLDAGKNVTVAIEDQGVGIAAEHLPYIFDRFYRVSQDHQVEGTGLGLTIVKAIVERHGGHIEVKSEINKGSTFMVVLPSLNHG